MEFTISANPSNVASARHLIAESLEARLKDREYVFDAMLLVGELLTECMDTTPPHVSLVEIGIVGTECGYILKLDSPHPLNVKSIPTAVSSYGVKVNIDTNTVRVFFPTVTRKSLLQKAN